jgi:hypothetical protein
LCPYNPSAEEVGGLDGFLYEEAQNFEGFSNDGRGFVGPKKKTIVSLRVFNHLWSNPSK